MSPKALHHGLWLLCLTSTYYRTPTNAERISTRPHNSLDYLKIIGGTEAEKHAFPFLVGIALKQPPEKSGWCGGALISAEFVLTAAHCVKGVQMATLFIGAHNVRNESDHGITVNVFPRNILLHGQWTPRYVVHDIAMIRLPKAVHFSDTIRPIQLPDSHQNTSGSGTTLTAAGWGRTSRNVTVARPATVQTVDLDIVSDDVCKKLYYYYNSTVNLCMEGNLAKTTCRGDSGGPLFFTDSLTGEHSLVGITSYGKKCDSATVLTRVSFYLDWITDRLRAML